jgi:hypothetical protein
MKKSNLGLAFVTIGALVLGACESSTNAGGGTLTEAALVGKWNIASQQSKGWETDDAGNRKDVDTLETYPSGLNAVEYKSDKTFSVSLGGVSIGGTWSIKGDSLITVTSFLGLSLPSSDHVVINGKEGVFTSHEVDTEQDLVVTKKATKQ